MNVLFATTYGSGVYNTTTYNGSSSTSTGGTGGVTTGSGSGTASSTSAGGSTASHGSGVLTNTGFDILLIITVAAVIALAAVVTRIWKRPAKASTTNP